jgi:hypothetical protein
MTLPHDWETQVRETINGFPSPHREEILERWEKWIETNPEPSFCDSWSEFSAVIDDQEALYTERRVYLRKVANELRELEVPLTRWQRAGKVLAAIASVFLVIFLAISRAVRVTE